MSHNVMVTRTTTTTTTTSAILLNTGYLKTLPGVLKLLQVVIGAIVVGLLANYSGYWPNYDFQAMLFLLLIATSCLIATGCLLISCLLSISTATIIAKTMFDVVYHGVALFLYLASSVNLLVVVSGYRRHVSGDAVLAAGMPVLLVPQSVLYIIGSVYHISVLASRNYGYEVAQYGYNNLMFAGALGAVNAVLYGVGTFLAFRNSRRA